MVDGKRLSSLDGLPFQKRSKLLAVTVVKKNIFVVTLNTRIMSVGPSVVKIRCQV